ncbi:MAG: hypothetical protein AABX37_03125 [Nanoarchaeota archaeon]
MTEETVLVLAFTGLATLSTLYILHKRHPSSPLPRPTQFHKTPPQLETELRGFIGQYRVGTLPQAEFLNHYARIGEELRQQCKVLSSYTQLHSHIADLGEIVNMKAKLLHRRKEYAHDLGVSVHYLFSPGPPLYIGIVADNLEDKVGGWNSQQFLGFINHFWPAHHHL